MYVRVQKVRQGGRVYEYVHIVEGYRDEDGKVRHRVVANLGRRDRLKDSGRWTTWPPRSPGWTRRRAAICRRHAVGRADFGAPRRGRHRRPGLPDAGPGPSHPRRGDRRVGRQPAHRPPPLYDVAGWANTYATNDWLGTPGALLNDDRSGPGAGRCGRPHRRGRLGGRAGGHRPFGVDAARLHWDFTSVAFCGAYDDQDPTRPASATGTLRTARRIAGSSRSPTPPPRRASRCSVGWSTAPATKAPKPATCSNTYVPWRHRGGCCWWPTRRWSPRPTWPPPTRRDPLRVPSAPHLRLRDRRPGPA